MTVESREIDRQIERERERKREVKQTLEFLSQFVDAEDVEEVERCDWQFFRSSKTIPERCLLLFESHDSTLKQIPLHWTPIEQKYHLLQMTGEVNLLFYLAMAKI